MYSLKRTHYYNSHIILFNLLLLVTLYKQMLLGSALKYQINLDNQNSPPAIIPTSTHKMKYSVPLNEVTSYPIFAYINTFNGSKVDDSLHNMEVLVTSISSTENDTWMNSDGKLCQNTNPDVFFPERYNRFKYYMTCGSDIGPTTLKTKVFNKTIIIDWVIHYHKENKMPSTSRIYKIEVPKLNILTSTHPINITTPAAKLVITEQPPTVATANTGFTVAAEIHDNEGNIVTTGLDSIAFVELTVPYRYKKFYFQKNLKMLLKITAVRLAGNSTMIHQSTNDVIIRKQAVAGKVNFEDIRILDVVAGFNLNLTMYMARDPWFRIPNCKTCYDDTLLGRSHSYEDYIEFPPLTKPTLAGIPGMTFTNYITVEAQKFKNLKIIHNLKSATSPIKITRNFPIPGQIKIMIIDDKGKRIYSGPDSKLDIYIKTIPPNKCLSSDMSRMIVDGLLELRGSICEIIDSVRLEIFSTVYQGVSVQTPAFKVTGQVHIGHLGNFNVTGTVKNPYPHIDTFVKFAASDITSGQLPGIFTQYGMSVTIESFNTKDDLEFSIQQYQIHREVHKNSESELRGILLSSNPLITKAIARNTIVENLPVISLTDKDDYFLGDNSYNSICWKSSVVYDFFLNACKERKWTKVSVITSSNCSIDTEFNNKVNAFNIEVKTKVNVAEFDSFSDSSWKPEFYGEEMRQLKEAGTKIIICFSIRSLPYILRSGIRFGISTLDNYQWLFLNEYAHSFPLMNEAVCQIEPKCTIAYRGSLLFFQTFKFSNFKTEKWIHVLERFYSIDRTKYLGSKATYPNKELASFLAIGYDGMWLMAQAISNIVSRQMTAYGDEIGNEMKKVKFVGLSGKVALNHQGRRTDFTGNIILVNPITDTVTAPNLVALPIRLIEYGGATPREYIYEVKSPLNLPPYNLTIPPLVIPKSVANLRKYTSYTGVVSRYDDKLIEEAGQPWPSEIMQRQEWVIPPFTCEESCGHMLSQEDVTLFSNGKCIKENTCKCFPGYEGNNCTTVQCPCKHGFCHRPNECMCYIGWSGPNCKEPVCENKCIHGKCVMPGECVCISSMWLGGTCSIHLAAILAPIGCSIIFLICIIYLLMRYFIKRIHLRTALANFEWLVLWDEVSKVDNQETDVKKYSSGPHVNRISNELYTWKREKWFVKRLNCRTVDLDDEAVRLEMVELTTLNHKNLIIYGGACLTYPNVSFFIEPASKGSLEDILVNDAIHLGWDFRFSFLKDICSGMEFIHNKTNIGSHGRLKSSNCLLDNRWCIRLTSFGCPSIRYGNYLMAEEDFEWESELRKMHELLWTAPELLTSAEALNDIQMGTKEGDVYSFGIIASEIVTRDVPFAYEQMFLPVSSILDLIAEKNSPVLGEEKKIWQSIGGDIFVIRPQLKSELLPEGKTTQKKFLKMLEEVWNDEPLIRPTFSKLLLVLDNIYPTKGELMDNLIRLLESYSNNLEQVVIERTHDLEAEKAKVDNIISQMLPKKVVEELKHGNKVEPEDFSCVTVFYSDIVGFTTIAKNSQPMQVVDLLNNLYSTFDSILHKYDVYKVETIGDAYVVASGVPERNGNAHAGEITTAAMDLVITMLAMKVPHLPKCKLLLRIGVHSGPVVAGVVGLKMPRYTLFGDTMLIAATMESSSEPLRIQLSEHTVKILDELGGYETELRGEMTVAGRALTTFWLISKKGYEGTLPSIES